jgi:POT family proton-dependent oligopeptide transporter
MPAWASKILTTLAEAAKPSYQEEYGRKHKTPWNDLFIEEIKRALVACRVFVFYPIYWVVYSQMLNNFISQGS